MTLTQYKSSINESFLADRFAACELIVISEAHEMSILLGMDKQLSAKFWLIISICFMSLPLLSGCMSFGWYHKIERELEPDSIRNISKTYMGHYLGVTTVEGIDYHNYIFPDVYTKSESKFIKILVSTDLTKQITMAITMDSGTIPKANVAFVNYSYLENWVPTAGTLHPLNPRYILEYQKSRLSSLPTDYPSLVSITMGRLGDKTRLRVGRKLTLREHTALEGNKIVKRAFPYNIVCPETSKGKYCYSDDYPFETIPDPSGNCEIWQWTDIILSQNYYGCPEFPVEPYEA